MFQFLVFHSEAEGANIDAGVQETTSGIPQACLRESDNARETQDSQIHISYNKRAKETYEGGSAEWVCVHLIIVFILFCRFEDISLAGIEMRMGDF